MILRMITIRSLFARISILALVTTISLLPRYVFSVHFVDDRFLQLLDERRQQKPTAINARGLSASAWSDDPSSNEEMSSSSSSSCRNVRILLTSEDIDAGFTDGFDSYADIDFGTIQGGKVLISDPDDETEKIGEYTALTTFLSPVNLTTFQVDCYGVGAYQFGLGEQISFVSPCMGTPYFTITGGQGSFTGATGYVEYMIKDPKGRGFFHDIHVCTATTS